ncbi:MAG: response regulator [Armatimonadota bacterium]
MRVLRVCPAHSVLIAEDDALVLTLLVRLFDGPCWRVIARENGPAALHAIEDDRTLELLILDMDMPVFGGAEVCRRACDSGCRIPAILITGCAPDDVDFADLPANAVRCIQKPFNIDRLPRIAELLLAARECRAPAC